LPQTEDPRSNSFRSFILKIHERCNLSCDYCYVYELNDQSWRSRPQVMSRHVVDSVSSRISAHAAEHAIPDVDIVLHGGEPLLAGAGAISYAVRAIRSSLGSRTRAHFSVQTNGTLLDENFTNLFEDLDVRVGLSLDGDATMHDRHRTFANGNGSYAKATAAADLLASRPQLFSGILSVIDLNSDPVRSYEALTRFSPPDIDFLLPHGNWSVPPPGRAAPSTPAPYGRWLARLFDHWYHAGDESPGIRLFEDIMSLILGGSSRSEDIGLSPVAVVIVESDGQIALTDVLGTNDDATGLNVIRDSFDTALRAPQAAAVLAPDLPSPCRGCPVSRVCGGGLHAHRYRAGSGYDNPSVYCPDLYYLISHIQRRVAGDIARAASGAGRAGRPAGGGSS